MLCYFAKPCQTSLDTISRVLFHHFSQTHPDQSNQVTFCRPGLLSAKVPILLRDQCLCCRLVCEFDSKNQPSVSMTAGVVQRLCVDSACCNQDLRQRHCHARVSGSDVADLDHPLHQLALAVIPRVRITTRDADDAKTSRLHATASAVRANIAVASIASKHSLEGIGGGGLHGIDLVNIALESCAVLQGHHRAGARILVDELGVGFDRAA
jgi:hypothetical protein